MFSYFLKNIWNNYSCRQEPIFISFILSRTNKISYRNQRTTYLFYKWNWMHFRYILKMMLRKKIEFKFRFDVLCLTYIIYGIGIVLFVFWLKNKVQIQTKWRDCGCIKWLSWRMCKCTRCVVEFCCIRCYIHESNARGRNIKMFKMALISLCFWWDNLSLNSH